MLAIRGMRRTTTALAAALLIAAVLPAAAAAGTDTLSSGGTLVAGQQIVSPDGHYVLLMQNDGNLVEYFNGGRALWSTRTNGDNGARAVMQQDGNLVLYDPANAAVWSSNSRTAGCPRLVVQNDGNVVVYATQAIWANAAVQSVLLPGDVLRPGWGIYSPSEALHLIMQGDGNLVLYDAAGHPLWNSRTEGHPGSMAIMQGDGNLVVYAPGGHPLWANGTAGRPGARLALQSDGNLVIYLGSTALWSSRTNGHGGGGSQAGGAPPPVSCAPPPPPPPPPVASAPPPPVVTVPVSTPIPRPAAPRHLRVKVVLSWTWNRAHTWLHKVTMGSFPAHTRILIECRGGGCPRHLKAHATGVRRLRQLLRALEGRRYHSGDRLLITLNAPGYLPERAEVTFRYGRLPRITLLRA